MTVMFRVFIVRGVRDMFLRSTSGDTASMEVALCSDLTTPAPIQDEAVE